jgi:hypothetical protein
LNYLEDFAMSHVNINITPVYITKHAPFAASCEASTIRMMQRADTITLIKTNEKSFVFQHTATDRDVEGDVRYWKYVCRTRRGDFVLVVFND